MNYNSVNNIYYSFVQFLDNRILTKGSAYTNFSSLFYPMNDPALPGYSIYGSPFKQFVSDQSVSGANIPSGVYVNGNFCPKGTTGLYVDYLNGRAIFSGDNNNLTVSGNYAVKDYNIYPTTESDETLIFETAYHIQQSFNRPLSGVDSRSVVAPCIFISNVNFSNQVYAFGGLNETICNFHCVIMATSKDSLDALGNIIVDMKYNSYNVTNASTTQSPYNYFGDYKSGVPFNYFNQVISQPNPYLAYISSTDFYRLNSKDFSSKYPDLKCGFSDIQVKVVRANNF